MATRSTSQVRPPVACAKHVDCVCPFVTAHLAGPLSLVCPSSIVQQLGQDPDHPAAVAGATPAWLQCISPTDHIASCVLLCPASCVQAHACASAVTGSDSRKHLCPGAPLCTLRSAGALLSHRQQQKRTGKVR